MKNTRIKIKEEVGKMSYVKLQEKLNAINRQLMIGRMEKQPSRGQNPYQIGIDMRNLRYYKVQVLQRLNHLSKKKSLK